MSALLFIDTNIYLDFYRRRGSGTSLSMLKHFDGNLGRIITTMEVEMEYKKNRQGVILLSLHSIKKPDDSPSIEVPDFLRESQLNISLTKAREQFNKTISQKIEKLRDRTSKLLENPSYYDPVYKVLQRLFKAREQCHLYRTRDQKLHDKIRILAQERFTLGYPPKKDKDLSINDAINWEWIIYCAQNYSDDIVIVSRDSDYGIVSDKDVILNDWLRQEFNERVGRKSSIILTNLLAEGFKRASIQVTPQEVAEEEKHIQDTWQSISSILANAASINIPPGTWNTLANAASINIPPGTWNTLANAASLNIPPDISDRVIDETTPESSQEEKENDTT